MPLCSYCSERLALQDDEFCSHCGRKAFPDCADLYAARGAQSLRSGTTAAAILDFDAALSSAPRDDTAILAWHGLAVSLLTRFDGPQRERRDGWLLSATACLVKGLEASESLTFIRESLEEQCKQALDNLSTLHEKVLPRIIARSEDWWQPPLQALFGQRESLPEPQFEAACRHCGKSNVREYRYCRSCGLSDAGAPATDGARPPLTAPPIEGISDTHSLATLYEKGRIVYTEGAEDDGPKVMRMNLGVRFEHPSDVQCLLINNVYTSSGLMLGFGFESMIDLSRPLSQVPDPALEIHIENGNVKIQQNTHDIGRFYRERERRGYGACYAFSVKPPIPEPASANRTTRVPALPASVTPAQTGGRPRPLVALVVAALLLLGLFAFVSFLKGRAPRVVSAAPVIDRSIEKVDFRNYQVPLSASCAQLLNVPNLRTIRLHNGAFHNARGTADLYKVFYADLDGDGREEAIVPLCCTPAMAANSAATDCGQVNVYGRKSGRTSLLDRLNASATGAETGLKEISISGENLIVFDYYAGGPICCPEYLSRRSFRLQNGRLGQAGEAARLPLPH